MSLTKRARKRLALLTLSILGVIIGVGVLWFVQQEMKDVRSTEARRIGFEAAAVGDWPKALANLSTAVARNNQDLEGLLLLAEVRGQVAIPEGKHFASALKFFDRAYDLADSSGASFELKLEALRGRSRMELKLGQIARLSQSAMEILEIAPNDEEALSQLLAIGMATDEILPSDIKLLIRGDRSFDEWLASLEAAEDNSAMRWALAKLIAEPDSNPKFFEFADLLLRSKSSVVQEAILGQIVEPPIDVAEAWASEFPSHANGLQILLAQEALRELNIEGARENLSKIDLDRMSDPRLILYLAGVYGQFGTTDPELVNTLLAKAGELVDANEELRIDVGTRLWSIGRIKDGLDLLGKGVESDSVGAEFLTSAVILAKLSNDDRFEDWLKRLQDLPNVAEKAVADRGRLDFILSSLELSNLPGLTQDRVREQCGNFGGWITDPMVLSLLADVCDGVGLNLMAINGYEMALSTLGGQSAPIYFNLCKSLLKERSFVRGFETASKFYATHPSLRSLLILCQAWIALESSGMKADQVNSVSFDYATASEFLEFVMDELDENPAEVASFEPIYLRSLIVSRREEDAVAFLSRRVPETTSAEDFSRLVSVAVNSDLILGEEILVQIESRSDVSEAADFGRALRANRIRAEQGPEAVFEYLSSEFEGRDDNFAIQTLGFAELQATISRNGDLTPVFERLLASSLKPNEFQVLLGAAVQRKNRLLAARMVQVIRVEFGENSREAAVAEGKFVLQFDTDDPDSMLNVTRRIDPLVASGQAGPELSFLYARILAMGSATNRKMAIQVLQASFARNPEHFVTGLLLAELLQGSVQFSDAGLILNQLSRRRMLATPEQKMRLSMMFGRQGDIAAMASSICEMASETGEVSDLLDCMRIKLEAGDFDAANAVLNELAIRPDRTSDVELEVARRFVRANKVDNAIAYLNASSAFTSEFRRDREVATILMNSQRWGEAKILLDGSVSVQDSPEAQLLLAIIMLNGDVRELGRARKALDRAVELVPTEIGFLRRAANIAIADADLRGEASRYIDMLAAEGSENAKNQAKLLRIGLEFVGDSLDDASLRRLDDSAKSLLEDMGMISTPWNLYLDILVKRYDESTRLGNSAAAGIISERMVASSAEFASRFPGDVGPLRRQALIDLRLGNIASASIRAAAALDLVKRVRAPRLGDVMLMARVEFAAANYEAIIDLFEPFRDAIKKDPESQPVSWQLLFASLLLNGKVEVARDLYVDRENAVEGTTRWLNWLFVTEQASAEIALESAAIVVNASLDADNKLLVIGVLTSVYRNTNDPKLREELASLIAETGEELTSGIDLFRLQAAKIDFAAIENEVEAFREAEALFGRIDPTIITMLNQRESLEGSDRETADAYFSPVCIFVNNYIARGTNLGLAGEIPQSAAAPMLEKCLEAEILIAGLLPENIDVLDTRARLKLALGQLDEAMKMARIVLSRAPASPDFQLTVAEILLAQGDLRGAENAAKRAMRLVSLQGKSNEQLIAKITRVIEKCRKRAGRVLEAELEMLT